MDRGDLLKLHEEHKIKDDDVVIFQSARDMKEFFETVECPECSSSATPITNPRQPFKTGQISPNFLAKCTSCGCEFDPHTRVIVQVGQDRTYDDPRDPDIPTSR